MWHGRMSLARWSQAVTSAMGSCARALLGAPRPLRDPPPDGAPREGDREGRALPPISHLDLEGVRLSPLITTPQVMTPQDAEGVAQAVQGAAKRGLRVCAFSGGHSYGGYSVCDGGVRIDMRFLDGVSVDRAARTARIGGGAVLLPVLQALSEHNVTLSVGTCPSVGIAGLTLGGGHGLLTRRLGLTLDSMLGADVVLGNGTKVHASLYENPELFWALRGGGGGNFGIVTAFEFRTSQVSSTISTYLYNCPWERAAECLRAWSLWNQSPTAVPDDVSSKVSISAHSNASGKGPWWRGSVKIQGTCLCAYGYPYCCLGLLSPLTAALGITPAVRVPSGLLGMQSGSPIDLAWDEAPAACRAMRPNATACVEEARKKDCSRGIYAKSHYFAGPVSRDALDLAVGIFPSIPPPKGPWYTPGMAEVFFELQAYGGAVSRVGSSSTAFAFRNATAVAQYASYIPHALEGSAVAAQARAIVRAVHAALDPLAVGSYINYIDLDLVGDPRGWMARYYGENAARLTRAKATYDASNTFRFPFGIPGRGEMDVS